MTSSPAEPVADPAVSRSGRLVSEKARGFAVRAVVLLFVLVAAIAAAIWLWKSIEGSNSAVLAAAITASATVLVSTFGILAGRRTERRNEFERRRQEKRIPVYEQFVDFWFRRVLYASRMDVEPVAEKEMIEFFALFTRDLMIWGSDDVILRWKELRTQWSALAAPPTRDDSVRVMLGIEGLLLAMRRDIGYPETALPPGSLLGLFINDVEALRIPTSDGVTHD